MAFVLQREGQDHGVAAGRGRARGRSKIVGHHDVGPGRLRDMDVAVDAARQRQQARRVDLPRRALNAVGDADDAAVANADIGAEFVAGRHDGAAADGEIELRHSELPPSLLEDADI